MTRISVIVPATNGPATLESCLDALHSSDESPDEVIVVDRPRYASPACARNLGSRGATGDVLVFVDADVAVHADALTRLRTAFEADEELGAVFGSYDDTPLADGVVSAFRNLLHHHVHQSAAGRVTTFWTGVGAIRRDVFERAGAFDETLPYLEDVDLGMRLAAAGVPVTLDPEVQGTHLKTWSLGEMVRMDFWGRGVPWVDLLMRHRSSSTALNLGWRHRASAATCVLAVGAIARRRPAASAAFLLGLVVLNRSFYGLLLRRRGPLEAAAGVGLHAVHHLTATAAVPVGLARHLRRQRLYAPKACSRRRAEAGRPSSSSASISSPSSR